VNIAKINDFLKNIPQDLIEIIEGLEFYGFDVRIVGGAVRDILIDKEPRDIDMATDATPDEIIFVLNRIKDKYHLKDIDAHAIEHGTIKVTTNTSNLYEITSLAFQMREREGTIKVRQHRDWKSDALRRDFTINAMSMSLEGIVFDYLGGLNDLANQRIKFIGFYKLRMLLEPILILRFANVLAKFPDPKYNLGIINFISKNRKAIDKIKPETLKKFQSEIKTTEYPNNASIVLDALQLAPSIK